MGDKLWLIVKAMHWLAMWIAAIAAPPVTNAGLPTQLLVLQLLPVAPTLPLQQRFAAPGAL